VKAIVATTEIQFMTVLPKAESLMLQTQPRALGSARVAAKRLEDRSVLADLRHSGALKLVFPQGRRDCEAIMVNTAGGVTGGDSFMVEATAEPGATLTLTTQAAERAYRAQPGQTGNIRTAMRVGAGARLNWLPQELILYDSCALHRRLRVELAPDATFLMVEPVVFGRAAMGERLSSARFSDRIKITRAGVPLYRDGVELRGELSETLARPAIARGAGAMAGLVYVAPDADAQLGALRPDLPDQSGASLLQPNVLVLRCLAQDSHAMRQTLLPVLDRLTGQTLPVSWRL
jgi:urease accessory protein